MMPELGKLEDHNEAPSETPLVAENSETNVEAAEVDSAPVTQASSSEAVPAQGEEQPLSEVVAPHQPFEATEETPDPVGDSAALLPNEDGDLQSPATESLPVEQVEAVAAEIAANTAAPVASDAHVEEGTGEFPPELADWDAIDDFADSVVTGLEEAGISIEPTVTEPQVAHAGDEVALPDADEAFFAGWGVHSEAINAEPAPAAEQSAPEALHEPDAAREEGESSYQSLAEIGLASTESLASDFPAGSVDDFSGKHDELADAVQSALESIYGGISPGLAASAAAFAFSDAQRNADAAAKPEAARPAAGQGESLSPQDVILSYFDYEAKKQAARSTGDTVFASAPTPRPSADAHKPEPKPYRPAEPQPTVAPQWAPPPGSLYQGAPSYPVPTGFVAPPPPAAARESSSRVLGAAAIGLVGGIAIAASLAVFVINSYGPQLAKTTTASRVPDAPEPGYGPPIRFDTETQQAASADEVRIPTESARIAVADASATPGQPAPLAITVRADRLREQALVSITGLPAGTRLNAGVDAGGGNWLLPPNRLNGLTINLPQNAPETVPLAVELVDAKARTPLSDRQEFSVRLGGGAKVAASDADRFQNAAVSSMAMTEIAPEPTKAPATPSFSTQTVSAAAPTPRRAAAPAQPTPSPFAAQAAVQPEPQQPAPVVPAPTRQAALAPQQQPEPDRVFTRSGASVTEIEDMIREGNKRMREGDILQARQFYQKAVTSGDPEAALAMGRSYDPIYFARIEKKNAEPDAAKAFDWYRKAMDGGATQTAKVRIENLKHFLNE